MVCGTRSLWTQFTVLSTTVEAWVSLMLNCESVSCPRIQTDMLVIAALKLVGGSRLPTVCKLCFQVLQPDCPTMPHCFADNNCSTTCIDSDTFTCHTGSLFYPLAHACGDSTLPYSPTPSPSTGSDVTYKVKALLEYTITAVGLNVYRLNTSAAVIEVNPGDVIGYSTKRGSGRIGTGPVGEAKPKDRIFNIDTPSVGVSLNSAHSLSVERHLLTVRQLLDRPCIPL